MNLKFIYTARVPFTHLGRPKSHAFVYIADCDDISYYTRICGISNMNLLSVIDTFRRIYNVNKGMGFWSTPDCSRSFVANVAGAAL